MIPKKTGQKVWSATLKWFEWSCVIITAQYGKGFVMDTVQCNSPWSIDYPREARVRKEIQRQKHTKHTQ